MLQGSPAAEAVLGVVRQQQADQVQTVFAEILRETGNILQTSGSPLWEILLEVGKLRDACPDSLARSSEFSENSENRVDFRVTRKKGGVVCDLGHDAAH